MPPAAGLSAGARTLYDELERRYRNHAGGIDSFMYNGGTILALISSGAAGVLATVHPFVAAILSGTASFFIAVTRILNFGGRWRWHLQRRARYANMIYELNSSTAGSAEDGHLVLKVYRALMEERTNDGFVPGSGEPVATDPKSPE